MIWVLGIILLLMIILMFLNPYIDSFIDYRGQKHILIWYNDIFSNERKYFDWAA